MTDAHTRAQRFAALVVPAAECAGYTGHGARARLARDVGMSESSVSRMLNGQAVPDMTFWAPLAEALDIELLDLLTVMGIPRKALRPLSETEQSQVGSRSITPEEAASRVGITDPVGIHMLTATIERLKRSQEEQTQHDQPGDERGGTAAQM